ncbi:uncharacterized protein LACBIDRAFT_296870 [Laccaria bicolor S238N-H82]|uniref:Predicted protein n=1 Tax=Laccaria bicolor (strain S238N-H82 / ATCC MYA-4686) TaxID=486041 RepID=B0D9G4_LACBS|nr:uncharacterized protein LACBIDRAFT_296870 [Laccaria bicolor S238N-H82]EDR08576.1 predicted protein [Laccaria bicolor S238N-H82]|eukprot:XP_001880801.1 predicted protein [Laccaria bicolor S238N-H82]
MALQQKASLSNLCHLTITRKCLLKSRLFGALQDDLVIMFGCFGYTLKPAISKRSVELEADAGPPSYSTNPFLFGLPRWLASDLLRTRLTVSITPSMVVDSLSSKNRTVDFRPYLLLPV